MITTTPNISIYVFGTAKSEPKPTGCLLLGLLLIFLPCPTHPHTPFIFHIIRFYFKGTAFSSRDMTGFLRWLLFLLLSMCLYQFKTTTKKSWGMHNFHLKTHTRWLIMTKHSHDQNHKHAHQICP